MRFGRPCSLCALLCLFLVTFVPNLVRGQDESPPVSLPVQRIVLFNTGVGYFEHRGEIEDNADVELPFDVSDIDDLLKSMVVQDTGGRSTRISYRNSQSLNDKLATFSVDLRAAPTMGELLLQLRGEEVELELTPRFEARFSVWRRRTSPAKTAWSSISTC